MSRTSHHAKSKVGRRRSQLARKPQHLTACVNCGGPTLAHKACPQCGTYKKAEKKVVAKVSKVAK
ncbi:MAG: 50S ribosomal protein L32 [bacterium]|nr:50S ribosomal protein L32 [Candidatus Jorgensenbacteria bacterium]